MTAGARIVVVLPDLRLGGAQRVLLDMTRQFALFGHDVEIVSLAGDGELIAEVPQEVRYRPIPIGARGGVRLALTALPALVHHLRLARPDAVLSSMTGTNLLTVVAHRLAGRPGRLVLREAVSLTNNPGRFNRLLMTRLYVGADAFVAVSSGVADDLAALGLDPSLIHVLRNSVDIERVRRLAVQAGQPRTSPYIVSVARLTAQKDQRTLLRAYAVSTLRRSHRLVMVGDGEDRPALTALAHELQIEDRVEFTGALANPYPVLAGASLHVLSSRWEGYPNVLLEALALGVPVVATDCPAGPRELLQGGRFGRLTPVGDCAGLAEGMDAELAAPTVERSLALAGCDPETLGRRYLDVLLGRIREDRL